MGCTAEAGVGRLRGKAQVPDRRYEHGQAQEGSGRSEKDSQHDEDRAKEFGECGHKAPERWEKGDPQIRHTATDAFPPFRSTC